MGNGKTSKEKLEDFELLPIYQYLELNDLLYFVSLLKWKYDVYVVNVTDSNKNTRQGSWGGISVAKDLFTKDRIELVP